MPLVRLLLAALPHLLPTRLPLLLAPWHPLRIPLPLMLAAG